MSATRGEGRATAEKSQRVVEPASTRKARRDAVAAEEARWAALAGPVTTTTKTPDASQGDGSTAA